MAESSSELIVLPSAAPDVSESYSAADEEISQAITRTRKLEIAERSYRLLKEEYGIEPEDIFFDALVFPIGTGDANVPRVRATQGPVTWRFETPVDRWKEGAGSWKHVGELLVAADACPAERLAAVEVVEDERVGAELEQRDDGVALS